MTPYVARGLAVVVLVLAVLIMVGVLPLSNLVVGGMFLMLALALLP